MPVQVLMVCLGNICRSPLAEGILRDKTRSDKVLVDSAGTAGYHIGEPPDRRSIQVAKMHGIDISKQRARKLHPSDLKNFDFIFAMDHNNLSDIKNLSGYDDRKAEVRLLLQGTAIGTEDVPDPYYGSLSDFEEVFELLDTACTGILPLIEGKQARDGHKK